MTSVIFILVSILMNIIMMSIDLLRQKVLIFLELLLLVGPKKYCDDTPIIRFND